MPRLATERGAAWHTQGGMADCNFGRQGTQTEVLAAGGWGRITLGFRSCVEEPMADETLSCVGQTEVPAAESAGPAEKSIVAQEAKMDIARAGAKAPDFSGMAYQGGAFKQVSLSDYAGKWVVLCFYPGDFTFV